VCLGGRRAARWPGPVIPSQGIDLVSRSAAVCMERTHDGKSNFGAELILTAGGAATSLAARSKTISSQRAWAIDGVFVDVTGSSPVGAGS